ncbi:MAG: hypothetical protein NTW32_18470, partial [Chloroflexi bacterium]|nr:hypothetical protein [Chloroflexota bacterium]
NRQAPVGRRMPWRKLPELSYPQPSLLSVCKVQVLFIEGFFIALLGEHFCQNCNRLRLTADGFLRPCLLLDGEINVREALRTNQPVLGLIQQAVNAKPKGHELFMEHYPESRRMAQIGG